MFAPRGPQKPKFKPSGINVFSLIRFLRDCEHDLDINEEKEAAYRFSLLREYFEKDYEEGKPLRYDSRAIGFFNPDLPELRNWIPPKHDF